jgi:putative flippase GtrA
MVLGRIVRLLGNSQLIRFLITGVVNTLFGLGVYVACIAASLAPWLAMLVGTVAGIAFNFFSLGSYAFRDRSLHRLPRFVCSYGLTYLFNLAAFDGLHGWVRDPVWCQVLLTPVVALFSYLLMSRFVFGRRKPE